VHFVVSSVSANTVPIWLHEGIAKYEETRWDGAAGRALTPYSETLLYEAVAGKRRFITFKEMSPSMALLPSQEATALAFAEVFSLVEYLVSARGGYPNLRRLIATLKEGTPERQAVRSVYGQSFDRLVRAWKAWLEERPRRAHGHAVAERLTFREDVGGKRAQSAGDEGDPSGDLKDADARRLAHLGELLRLEGRPKAAVVEYEKAYAITGPEAVHLANKLARTYLGLGRAKEAETLLLEVRDVAPSLVTTHINLGRAYLLQDRPEAALAAYRKAAEQNPFDPEIHAALAKIYRAQGDEARARREAQALALTSSHIEAIRRQHRSPEVADTEMGQLSIHTTPWAKVRIDGEDDGLTTPVFRYPLPPGEHTVTLRTAGGVTRSVPVTIEKAKEARIVLDLGADPETPPAP
jgi:tetratricopeptide (TPR) repeat protein